ncbi:MAG: type II secretion system secretin GspD [Deltaproteobacteria bacterium]|nr:type II secretion system secretin GspD [Deltaproteobacteria bacterium]
MSIRAFVISVVVFLQLVFPGFSCLAQAGTASAPKGGISLDFKNIELPDLIKAISKITRKNFVYDGKVRGKVTLISPRRVSLEQAYQTFLAVLNIKGYVVVPSGSVNKIITFREAKRSNVAALSLGGEAKGGEEYVTRIFRLHNISVIGLATPMLMSLVPKSGNIVAYPQTNTLIVSGRSGNLDKLAEILRQLDVPDHNRKLVIIELAYANAEDIAKIINQVGSASSATRRSKPAAMAHNAKVIPYPPTNVLVVMAGDDDIKTVRSIVARLDQKPNQKRAGIQVYYLENADAETLAKTLNEIITGIKASTGGARAGVAAQKQSLKGVSITADKPTNSLIINSTPEEYVTVRNIIKKLDIKRKQVYVEALILEVSMDATKKLGVSLQGAVNTSSDGAIFARSGLNTDNLTVDPTNPLASAVKGILLGGIFNPMTVVGPDGTNVTVPALSVLIDLSKTDSGINILSAPQLLTSDNEEAEIIVGSNVPIITSRLTNAVGSGSSGLASSVTVERKDVALTLRFTPQITEGNLVRLKVYQEITNLAASSVGNVDNVGPSFTKRLIRNTVLVENGHTVVLGGLIDSNVQNKIIKVPLLGDIPLLGWLFKSKTTVKRKTNLLVFITPRIIKNSADLAAVTKGAQKAMNLLQNRAGTVLPVHLKRPLAITPNGSDKEQK